MLERGRHKMDLGDRRAWWRRLEDHCAANNIALTPLRRQMLALLCSEVTPKGAYDLLRELGANRGRAISPPTIYRSLEYLIERGLVIRIESRNAYVARKRPGISGGALLYVCSTCSSIVEAEVAPLDHCLRNVAAGIGFRIDRQILELEGVCQGCTASQTRVENPVIGVSA